MIRAVKREISVPLIVGGGISHGHRCPPVRQAGADMVVTGTIENAGYRERLRSILSALGNSWREPGIRARLAKG